MNTIIKKSRYEISLMETAGSIVAEVLETLREASKPGVSTFELDEIAENIILKNQAVPTFKGYHGFPASICASINEQVVHGIPSKEVMLEDGDIISIDVGATYKGLVGDSAITVPVGNVSPENMRLIDMTRLALYNAIEKVANGVDLQEVSAAIEDLSIESGLGVVKTYGGHGVGRNMHEPPFVYNCRTNTPKVVLKTGMTIAIEPMFNLGTGDVHSLDDGWTVVTNDNKFSAHFEHSVLVTDDGYKILTLKD